MARAKLTLCHPEKTEHWERERWCFWPCVLKRRGRRRERRSEHGELQAVSPLRVRVGEVRHASGQWQRSLPHAQPPQHLCCWWQRVRHDLFLHHVLRTSPSVFDLEHVSGELQPYLAYRMFLAVMAFRWFSVNMVPVFGLVSAKMTTYLLLNLYVCLLFNLIL